MCKKSVVRGFLGVLSIVLTYATVVGHPDDPKPKDRQAVYRGPGYRIGQEALRGLQFPSSGITLLAHITIPEFNNGSFAANDCWGYTSPSGREYAIIGLSEGTGFVEISSPSTPQIIAVLPGPSSSWRDIKTYQTYAYAVSEAGDGIQVFDLAQIDAGIVSFLGTVITGGTATHNVALNEDSGFLYRTGGSGNGLLIYSLANPAIPTLVATWPDRYVHDAQIVSFTTGPYAGKEIAFCCSGLNGGSVNTGIDILDVTNKQNIISLAQYQYPTSPQYSHQAWLSPDRQLLYLNDELNGNLTGFSTTHVLDVSDLANPIEINAVMNGSTAITHNLYTVGNFIYAANYRSGLRIFDATVPTAPVEVAFFDTYPPDDNQNFNGLWSNYPFFPSGTVIGSDIEKGLFIWQVGDPLLTYTYPNGHPALISPAGDSISVQINEAQAGQLVLGTETLHYDTGAGFITAPLTPLGGGLYNATFPSINCPTAVRYYVSAQSTNGITWSDPAGAPGTTFNTTAATNTQIILSDNFEINNGWTPANLGATSGDWQRGVPVNDPAWVYDPATDGDGSGQCWLTMNQIGNTDVDGGAVELTSPVLDMSMGNMAISYDYYLYLTDVSGTDQLLVEVSGNGDAGPWVPVTAHLSDGGNSWRHHEITPNDLAAAGVPLTLNTKVRFTANDANPQSIVEAGIDGFQLVGFDCTVTIPCPGDITPAGGNGTVNIDDLVAVLNAFGPCPAPGNCPEDITPAGGNGTVNIDDLVAVLNAFGACP